MLTKEDLELYEKSRKEFEAKNKAIVKRVGEIIEVIFKAFGNKHDGWWFYGAEEGEHGFLDIKDVKSGWINLGFWFNRQRPNQRDMETDENNYIDGFPAKFLFMTNKEILIKLKAEIEKIKQNIQEENAAEQAKKQKIKDAWNKLTKEERRLLKDDFAKTAK